MIIQVAIIQNIRKPISVTGELEFKLAAAN